MYRLSVQNEAGNCLELTNNPNYTITKITGLTPPGATINSQIASGKDGEQYNSSRVNKRNIVITLHPEYPVDKNRNNLYDYFPLKQNIRLFYRNRIRDVWIDGRVETIEGDLFSMKEEMQISILCPQPYFIGKNSDAGCTLNFPPIIRLLEFPASFPEEGIVFSELLPDERAVFYNNGTENSGAEFHFYFYGRSEGVKITDIATGGFFGVTYSFKAYDNLYISTIQGKKSVKLKRGPTATNLLNHRLPGSSWIPVRAGKNSLAIEAGNYELELNWEEKYEGV